MVITSRISASFPDTAVLGDSNIVVIESYMLLIIDDADFLPLQLPGNAVIMLVGAEKNMVIRCDGVLLEIFQRIGRGREALQAAPFNFME